MFNEKALKRLSGAQVLPRTQLCGRLHIRHMKVPLPTVGSSEGDCVGD